MPQSFFESLEGRRLLASVSDVFVSGTAWTQPFRDFIASSGQGDATYGYRLTDALHADELPWINLNQVSVRFSEGVDVAPGALRVFGVRTPRHAGGFTYDPATLTATWTLAAGVFAADKLLIELDDERIIDAGGNPLDGEWTNPQETTLVTAGGADVFPSGDGTPGGDFLFRVNVLPGDVNRDGAIVGNDVTSVRENQGFVPGGSGYTIFRDVTGDAAILGNDVTAVRGRQGITLPSGTPVVLPPTAMASGPGQVGEGAAYTLALSTSDPERTTGWTIDWGDGVTSTAAAGELSALHVYADEASTRNIVATAMIDGASVAAPPVSVTVMNVAPSVQLYSSVPVDENSVFTARPSVWDGGWEDVLSGSINWGDGTPADPVMVAGGDVMLSHTYADDGTYTATLTVNDDDGASTSATFDVIVNNVAPTLVASGSGSIKPGESYTLSLSSSDPGDDTIQSWTIDWGDGETEIIAGNPTSVTHTFALAATHFIQATAKDEDGSHLANAAVVTAAAPGRMDSTFGVVTTALDDLDVQTRIARIATQPDGKLVVAGSRGARVPSGQYYEKDFWLARFNADGTPDVTFGQGGEVITEAPESSQPSQIVDVVILSDGKILAGGWAGTNSAGYATADLALARYHADGTLDTTFGSGGIVTQDFAGRNDGQQVYLLPQSDGRVVAVSRSETADGYRLVLVRYLADGTVDGSFGSGGYTFADLGPLLLLVTGAGVQPDGGIVVITTQQSGSTFQFRRFHTNGVADATFGSGGVVTTYPTSFQGSYRALVHRDGRIVIPGSVLNGTTRHLAVSQFNPDGTPDSSFGGDGVATADFGRNSEGYAAIAVQPDGKVIAGGITWTLSPSNQMFGLARFNADGSIDTTFGTNGTVTTDVAVGTHDRPMDIAVQPDGKFAVGGEVVVPGSTYSDVKTVVVRYLGDAPLDLDIDSDNDADLAAPARSAAEEAAEDVTGDDAKPGKVVLVNDADADGDGIPDYADGFDLDPVLTADGASTGVSFVPVVLELQPIPGQSFNAGTYKIKLSYDGSDPAGVKASLSDPYVLPAGALRLWTKDGAAARNKASVLAGGDYLAPGEYTAEQLGITGYGQPVTLYVEAVRASTTVAVAAIAIAADPTGSGSFSIADVVRLTVTRIEILGRGYGETEYRIVDRFLTSDLALEPEYGLTAGAFQIHKMRVHDPRITSISEMTIAGQTLSLQRAGGVYETPEFVMVAAGAPTSWSVPYQHITVSGSEVAFAYNPGGEQRRGSS